MLPRSCSGGLPARNVVILGWHAGGREDLHVIVGSWELFQDLITGICCSGSSQLALVSQEVVLMEFIPFSMCVLGISTHSS